jgi:hypothetical protein
MGINCELVINYCDNVTCLNKGVCRSLLLDYKCECVLDSSGRQCEYLPTSIVARQRISKGFAYIAIIIILTTTGYIFTLDILTYVFGIDVARNERNLSRHKRALRKKRNRKKRKPRTAIRLRRTNRVIPIISVEQPQEQPKF